ncbi:MAG: CAP domain-containing protein [Bacteroidetes bacterium]|nr:MAG: CAP domain-containing protein [Bacteroidota bacterium]
MIKSILTLLLLFCLSGIAHAQLLDQEEYKLYSLLMQYRKQQGLPSIPISRSLTFVAQAHVVDLADNKPDTELCNPHSWSDKGKWSACCFTDDFAESQCMWSKPRELTAYTGDGYEISCGSNACCSDFVMTAAYALESWKSSSGHNDVILNHGMWESSWNAVGIGIYKGFAVVWFGNEADTE